MKNLFTKKTVLKKVAYAALLLISFTAISSIGKANIIKEKSSECNIPDTRIILHLNSIGYEVHQLEFVDECTRIAYTQYYPNILVYVYIVDGDIYTQELPN